jgi:ketosteroid isomerase-like protein
MRFITLLSAAVISLCASAQISPELQSLIDAERSFANLSITQNTRAAFLANFDDKSIAFSGGNPHPGRKEWEQREANDGYLFWWPVFADIASGGDMGYTTGPAEWGGTIAEKKPVGGAYYSSVWRKDESGRWKIAADLGSARYNPASPIKEINVSTSPLKSAARVTDIAKEETKLFDIEKNYVAVLNEKKSSANSAFFAGECRIHRPSREPYINEAAHKLIEPHKFNYEFTGGGIAGSADLGYTYGKVAVQMVRDGKDVTLPMCYMRVWKKEGSEWKIVLDVIGQ